MKQLLEALRNLESFCLEWPELFETLNKEFNFEGLAGDIEQAINFDRNLEQVRWQVWMAIKAIGNLAEKDKVHFNYLRVQEYNKGLKAKGFEKEFACIKVYAILNTIRLYFTVIELVNETESLDVKQGQYQPE